MVIIAQASFEVSLFPCFVWFYRASASKGLKEINCGACMYVYIYVWSGALLESEAVKRS